MNGETKRKLPTKVVPPPLHCSVTPSLYRQRLTRGWSKDRAANEPAKLYTSTSIRVDGKRKPRFEVMRDAGVGINTYRSRIRTGWSVEKAASTPPGPSRRPDSRLQPLYEYDGRRMSLFAWAKELQLNYRTLVARINRGLSLTEAIDHPLRAALPKC